MSDRNKLFLFLTGLSVWLLVSKRRSITDLIRHVVPVLGSYRVTSRFGPRTHPVTGEIGKMHNGVDLAAQVGTSVVASQSGYVERLKPDDPAAGNFLVVRHNDKTSSKYLHLNNFAPDIKIGSLVSQGQVIGSVGMTGQVTGPHLHFEIRSQDDTPLDPENFVTV